MTLVVSDTLGPPRVNILGLAGVGKTQLAATFRFAYVQDIEGGGGSFPGPRNVIAPKDNAVSELIAELNAIGKAPWDDAKKVYNYTKEGRTFPVGTVVIDSVDALQLAQKVKLLGTKPKLQQQDWDILLNSMLPLITSWHSLRCSVVVIAHSRFDEGEDEKPGVATYSLQGAFRAQMPRWFDYIAHLVSGANGDRIVLTQPVKKEGYIYTAKDRHRVFGGKNVPIPLVNDRPDPGFARLIEARHYGDGISSD